MLITHVHLGGQCKEAIELYVKAFNAKINIIMQNPENDSLVIHAEISIHNQRLMLNDYGDNNDLDKSIGYQLVVDFENEDELYKAYSVMKDGSTTIFPMQATDYSVCVVRFIDKYDVRWAFMV